jgi:signal recognition particle subunit SRP54
MFDQLSNKIVGTLKDFSGKGKITESNVEDTLKQVRKALLDADVALPVVKEFIAQVKRQALGSKVLRSLSPGQAFVKIVHAELTQVMGEEVAPLNLKAKPPVVVLMCGLQGAGKTTSTAKLARWLIGQKKTVMVASLDVYRPAAIEQLAKLVAETKIECFPSDASQKPIDIARAAFDLADKKLVDVLLLDTAGRLHIDESMMQEVKELHQVLNPHETLFVVDAMTGQDAANTAKAFQDALPLTGVVLTKMDGDSRGGAALSVRHITGKPIKFMGVGEKTDALEPFYPERLASRILGMGDILSLVEEAEAKLDHVKAQKLVKKITKGKGFDFNDMLDQFQQMRQMGGMSSILDKLPGMSNISSMVEDEQNIKQMKRMEAMILSMTVKERSDPELIAGRRRIRIAKGSGVEVQEVTRLLKQQKQMQKMMKKMTGNKNGMKQALRGMQGMMKQGSH